MIADHLLHVVPTCMRLSIITVDRTSSMHGDGQYMCDINTCVTSSLQCLQPLQLAPALPAPTELQRSAVSLVQIAGTPVAALGPPHTAKPAKPRPKAKACAECGTADTGTWRKDPMTGSVMCNACGLRAIRRYEKQHGSHRAPQQVRLDLRWSIRPCLSCMCAGSSDIMMMTCAHLCVACSRQNPG